MTEFVWKGKNKRGVSQKGIIEAGNEEIARMQLTKRGLSSLKVQN